MLHSECSIYGMIFCVRSLMVGYYCFNLVQCIISTIFCCLFGWHVYAVVAGMKYDLRKVEEVYYDVKIRGLTPNGESIGDQGIKEQS